MPIPGPTAVMYHGFMSSSVSLMNPRDTSSLHEAGSAVLSWFFVVNGGRVVGHPASSKEGVINAPPWCREGRERPSVSESSPCSQGTSRDD